MCCVWSLCFFLFSLYSQEEFISLLRFIALFWHAFNQNWQVWKYIIFFFRVIFECRNWTPWKRKINTNRLLNTLSTWYCGVLLCCRRFSEINCLSNLGVSQPDGWSRCQIEYFDANPEKWYNHTHKTVKILKKSIHNVKHRTANMMEESEKEASNVCGCVCGCARVYEYGDNSNVHSVRHVP